MTPESAAASAPRRILFALDHPGRLINFGSTLPALAAGGHEVHISFTREKLSYALDAIDLSDSRITIHEDAPQRADRYTLIVHRVRRLADYVHYLDPSLEAAAWTRDGYRGVTQFPLALRWLKNRDRLPRPLVSMLLWLLTSLEHAAPTNPSIDAFVRSIEPDLVVVSPLILARSDLGDYLATARARRIPAVFAVASWDNLSSKGLVTQVPEWVTLWNEIQKREAVLYHRVPAERIVVTGSIQHDQWFDRSPASTPEEFKRRRGLPVDRPFLLFAGSTRQGRDPEQEVAYVREWVTALRTSDDPLLREIPILLRPHPLNASAWLEGDAPSLPGVVIWHRKDLFPFGEDEASDYFDGLSHCSALVGINTSAMIEAAIAGRPVHTIALPEWRAMQDDFLHFHYLFPEHGGFLRKAGSFGEHVELLGADIRDPSTAAARGHAFAETFLRPLGLSQPATPMFVAHLEAAAAAAPSARRMSELRALPFRLLLAAAVSRYRLRAARDVRLRRLYGATSVWFARHGVIGRIRLQRIALWLRQREDRALERLEWLGAFETDRRLPAEKWVYRRLVAERWRAAPQAPQPRQRPEKWLAAIGRERRAASLPQGTETGR
jgi:hypothetical protein